ncbi:MAG TPA: TerC/Alx family metal homeostasis membrane protein [Nitrososphaeraceae archaeon]|nr:TerC/Alx family metal homeostasis membrane protein [Nitrososphaeraceae archaeon]
METIEHIDPLILWIPFSLLVGIALAIDLGLFRKVSSIFKGKDSSQESEIVKNNNENKSGLLWTIVWISLAGIFALLILKFMGSAKALEFVTAYTLEKSLSVDNMFVFLLIFTSLSIPHRYQHRVLSVGILSAIAIRIPLILIGVSLIQSIHWMIYVFGALLILTATRMILQRKEKKIVIERNIAVRLLKKVVPLDLNAKTGKFLIRRDKIIHATPLLVALVAVEMTDLFFALDSIPAVLAITNDSFIVITSNIFAILGLRSLYYLLAGMIEKFRYLKPALVSLLLFIGVKMIISETYEIPLMYSLAVIFSILTIAIAFSVIKTQRLEWRYKY